MCAIVDANVANEVFGPRQSPAGEKFYDWITAAKEKRTPKEKQTPRPRLVVGGKLLGELEKGSPNFREVAKTLEDAGKMKIIDMDQVDARTEEIKNQCVSDDPHIIALAQISGARLLYTNESGEKKERLCEDFKNKNLIDQPRGRIYTTRINKEVTDTHRKLLRRTDLCQR